MKRVLIVIIIIGYSNLLFSQINHGLLIGYNSSQYIGSSESNVKVFSVPGIYLGYYCDILQKRVLDLETGIGITTKGNKLASIGDTYIRNIFVYLEMPITAKCNLIQNEKIDLFIFSGPSLNLKIFCFNWTGFIDDIRSLDLTLISGCGIKLNHLSLRTRYTYGLLNFDISDYNNSLKNSTISLEFGIEFGKK